MPAWPSVSSDGPGHVSSSGTTILYPNLREALEAHHAGENVASRLRAAAGTSQNTPEIIEISYDLQAGSYVEAAASIGAPWRSYVDEVAAHLAVHVRPGDRVLDVGTGEMTTLAGTAATALQGAGEVLACDISWTRLDVGRSFVTATAGADWGRRVVPFVADMRWLPLETGAVDVLWTAHALEPNGGRERELLQELMRVTRRRLVLFEPSYERNTDDGRGRMRSHGYVRGLPAAIEAVGGTLEDVVPIGSAINPLNPTHAYVLTPPSTPAAEDAGRWRCPTTGEPLDVHEGCLWSERARLAYPVLGGIPVLRREAAILAGTAPSPRR